MSLSRWFKPNRIAVPADLSGLIWRDRGSEVDPATVDMTRDQVETVWRSIERLYRTGLQPAIALTLRRQGRVVLRGAIGQARLPALHQPALPCTPETPLCLFSASKSITAMLVHKLVEQRHIGLDDRIARYLPEYGVQGKAGTTIRHLLAHRAGIPRVPKGTPAEVVFDWDAAVALLCGARPINESGDAQSYHAITGGFILGELIQRVTGAHLREVLRELITQPMGLDGMTYGLPEGRRATAALNYVTGPQAYFPLTRYVEHILSAPFEKVVEISNDPRFFEAVIPAGNIYASSDEVGAFYQMLLQNGRWNGRQIFKPQTIAEAVRPAGPIHLDRTLLAPVRFSAGFVLGEWPLGLYGRDCRRAYGHLGFLTTICWADPVRDISVGFVNTGKSLSADQLLPLAGVLGAISGNCRPLARARRAVD